jgi:hypothetical protein
MTAVILTGVLAVAAGVTALLEHFEVERARRIARARALQVARVVELARAHLPVEDLRDAVTVTPDDVLVAVGLEGGGRS